jgi:hypothetical protein
MIARPLLALLPLICLAAAAPPPVEGELGTLPHGRYVCELPGDAAGPSSRPVDGMWFNAINNSSYAGADGASGHYLLAGTTLIFTTGPMAGARFNRTSDHALERTNPSDGLTSLRCVRTGAAR